MDRSTDLAIGIDLGGTNTKFGLIDADGKILEKGRIKTADHPTIDSFINDLHQQLTPWIEKYKDSYPIRGIGIGAPNGNFFTGNIEQAVNLHWKGTVPIAKMISEKFGFKCVLNTDAKVAALGEHRFGAAKGMKNFIMLTLGTGVGSGIFLNDQLVYGCNGNAGELGHTVVIHNGRKHWSTGLKGTVEAYCSATGIAITAKELLKATKAPSLLRKYKKKELTSEVVYDCAEKEDKLAKKVFRQTGQILGEALANFTMFAAPEAIILFGGVTRAGDLLLEPAKKSMESNLISVFKGTTKVLISQLDLDDAAILGASTLV
jgi:glucokinase